MVNTLNVMQGQNIVTNGISNGGRLIDQASVKRIKLT